MRDNLPPLTDAEVRALTRNARHRQRRQDARLTVSVAIVLLVVAMLVALFAGNVS